jgi:integrase
MSKQRRGRGEHSVRKRKDGRWEATVSAGFDAEGRRVRYSAYGKTKTAALDQLDKLRKRKRKPDAPKCVEELLELWIADVATRRTAATVAWYRGVIDADIVPAIGRKKPDEVTVFDLQALYRRIAGRSAYPNRKRDPKKPPMPTAGDRTLQRVHTTLRAAFKAAVRWGALERSPVDCIQAPRYERPPIRAFGDDDLDTFLKAIDGNRYEALYLLAVFTGLREGELFGLHWSDVDLRTGTLRVQRILSDESGKPTIVERTKTRGSRRAVKIPRLALAALKAHRKKSATLEAFTSPEGHLIHRSNFLRKEFYPLLERAGLPRMRFHDLRHSFATLLLRRNVHPKVVQEILGHKRIGITMDTYSAYMPVMQEAAIDAIDDQFPTRLAVTSRSETAGRQPRKRAKAD